MTAAQRLKTRRAKQLPKIILASITRILGLVTRNKSLDSSNALSEDPPGTANAICYRDPSRPASPFNPEFEPIPDGKETRGRPVPTNNPVPIRPCPPTTYPKPPIARPCTPCDGQFSVPEYCRDLLIGASVKLGRWLEKNSDRSIHDSGSSTVKPQLLLTPPCTPIGAQFSGVEYSWCLFEGAWPDNNLRSTRGSRNGPSTTSPVSTQTRRTRASNHSSSTGIAARSPLPPDGNRTEGSRGKQHWWHRSSIAVVQVRG